MFIKIDKDWEKKKRMHQLRVAIKKANETKKDKFDLIEQLRREIEGNVPIVSVEQHTHYTSVNIKELESKEDREVLDVAIGRKNGNT